MHPSEAAPPHPTRDARPPDCSIYSTEQAPTLKGALVFELKSLLGRWFFNRRPPVLPHAPQLLNLGCGDRYHPQFVNADFFRLRKRPPRPNCWGLDLRHALTCPAEHWDGVFTEHTLEHLPPDSVRALLIELHRTMKRGSWLRIIVPDLAKYVDYYVGRPSHEKFNRWQPRGAALRSVTQNYQHVSLWDAELLGDCLAQAEFARIGQQSFRVGADPRLLIDTPAREYESLYVEAQKPS